MRRSSFLCDMVVYLVLVPVVPDVLDVVNQRASPLEVETTFP